MKLEAEPGQGPEGGIIAPVGSKEAAGFPARRAGDGGALDDRRRDAALREVVRAGSAHDATAADHHPGKAKTEAFFQLMFTLLDKDVA